MAFLISYADGCQGNCGLDEQCVFDEGESEGEGNFECQCIYENEKCGSGCVAQGNLFRYLT